MRVSIILSSKTSYRLFVFVVQSIPGGFRRAKSQKRDDFGIEGEIQGLGDKCRSEGQMGNQVRHQKRNQKTIDHKTLKTLANQITAFLPVSSFPLQAFLCLLEKCLRSVPWSLWGSAAIL